MKEPPRQLVKRFFPDAFCYQTDGGFIATVGLLDHMSDQKSGSALEAWRKLWEWAQLEGVDYLKNSKKTRMAEALAAHLKAKRIDNETA